MVPLRSLFNNHREIIAKYDVNGDGVLDDDEIAAMKAEIERADSDAILRGENTALISLGDRAALRQVFAQFGQLEMATVRLRSVNAAERPALDASRTPYYLTESGRLDTSWALVTMESSEAALAARRASPLEVVPGTLRALLPLRSTVVPSGSALFCG